MFEDSGAGLEVPGAGLEVPGTSLKGPQASVEQTDPMTPECLRRPRSRWIHDSCVGPGSPGSPPPGISLLISAASVQDSMENSEPFGIFLLDFGLSVGFQLLFFPALSHQDPGPKLRRCCEDSGPSLRTPGQAGVPLKKRFFFMESQNS